MIEWSESHQAIREMVKKFVETEVAPRVPELEHGDLPPYEVLRKMFAAFGMKDMAGMRAERAIARAKKKEEAKARGEELPAKEDRV
ncbi:MAG: fadE18, partial [Myxococcaceae bacterium]|nr:fadE18 [Myxococcaceae bacterium]